MRRREFLELVAGTIGAAFAIPSGTFAAIASATPPRPTLFIDGKPVAIAANSVTFNAGRNIITVEECRAAVLAWFRTVDPAKFDDDEEIALDQIRDDLERHLKGVFPIGARLSPDLAGGALKIEVEGNAIGTFAPIAATVAFK